LDQQTECGLIAKQKAIKQWIDRNKKQN